MMQFLMLNFISLTVISQTVTACPAGCLCDESHVNCVGLGLVHVPVDEIPNNTKSLILDDNFISDLGVGSFTSLGPWLRKLSLANNQLERLSNSSLSNLPKLRGLDLSRNVFSEVPSFVSQNLHSLRKLDLSRNALTYLAVEAFMGLPNLQELYLGGNGIQTVEEDAFSNLPFLGKISLKENSINVDPVRWFAGTAVEELDLSYNQIPLTSNIGEWFGGNDHLNVVSLILRRNGITALPRGTFRGLKKLQVLDLSGNELHTISKFSLYGLENLKELIIDDNVLTSIHEGSLLELTHLQVLSLDGNELKSLPKGLLNSTTTLKVLRAAFNALHDISAVTESISVVELSELILTSNQISNLTVSVYLSRLTALKLGTNHLSIFPNIQNAMFLQVIELSNNEINQVPNSAFQYNGDLREIFLDQNKLIALDYELFSDLPYLEVLSLGGNPWWCDCRLVWMQDLMWLQDQPPWATNFANDIICLHPPILQDTSLKFASLNKLQDQCPTFRLAVGLPVVLGLWLLITLLFLARVWTAQCVETCHLTKHTKSNYRYSSRLLRKRKRGFAGIAGAPYISNQMTGTHYHGLQDESDEFQELIPRNGLPTGKDDFCRETPV